GSVGAVGVSAAETKATLERTTEATISSAARITLTSGSLLVHAGSSTTASTSSRSDGGGVVGVPALHIPPHVNTNTRAALAPDATIVVPSSNLTGNVTVAADSQNLASANTVSYGGGGVNVQASTPTATDLSTTEASMLGNVIGPDGAASGAVNLVVRATA